MMTVAENVVCPSCGCLCDDLTVEVVNGTVGRVQRACANGWELFTSHDPASRRPTIDGRPADWKEAVGQAARILSQADNPLIYGLSGTSVEAQRQAVELADLLGATLDTTSSTCHGPTMLATQAVGQSSCTLGEVRNRADLLVFWGCNPAVSHPRHFARYSLPPRNPPVADGRRDRFVVVVDVRPTPTTRAADLVLQVQPGSDFEVLTALRALVGNRDLEAVALGGIPVARLRQLAQQMKTCRFGVVFVGVGLTMSRARDLCVAELLTLVTELNQHTRFCAMPMRGHGNVTGADQVLTWQTGYPFAISFARGYPRFGPGEFSAADVLARGEVDAALILASDPLAHLPGVAARRLREIPVVVLDPALNMTAQVARVVLPTACCGVDAPGTFYRMDGVPLRLTPVLPRRRPSDEEILAHIIEAVAAC